MSYQTAVTQEFIPRCTLALNNLRDALIAAGAAPAGIVVSMPDTTDLRFQIVAKRGNRTLTVYIELSDASHTGGEPGTAIFTLWLDVNGAEVTTTYTPGLARKYIDDTGLQALLDKLTELETKMPEVAVKARAALGL